MLKFNSRNALEVSAESLFRTLVQKKTHVIDDLVVYYDNNKD